MFEYVDMREPSLQMRIATDVKGVLVNEYGYPDTLATMGMAVMQHCFAGLKVRQKIIMRAPEKAEHEILWARRGLVPKALSFWVNTLVGAAGRERDMADRKYLFDQRMIEGRTTVFDL